MCFQSFDDNAEFRQKNVFQMGDTSESDPREVEAQKAQLNYIGLNGNIGCLGELSGDRIILLTSKNAAMDYRKCFL